MTPVSAGNSGTWSQRSAAFTIALGALSFVFNLLRSLRQPATAPDNPWDAPTLEWATSSPPPEHDFDVVPVVRARDPLWYDRDHGIERPEPTGEHIHMPPPSYYPILLAMGIALLAIGPLSHLALTAPWRRGLHLQRLGLGPRAHRLAKRQGVRPMAHAEAAEPVGGGHQTNTGVDNRKLLMWLFLGSECLFFGSLIATFLIFANEMTAPAVPARARD